MAALASGVTGAQAAAAVKQAVLADLIQRTWPGDADEIFEPERATPYSLTEIHRYVQRRTICDGWAVQQALRGVREWMRTHGWAPLPRS